MLRSLPDVASIYADEEHSKTSSNEDFYKSRAPSSIGNKRFHPDSSGGSSTTTTAGSKDKTNSNGATTTAAATEQKPSLPKDKLPNNFYKVANELFEEFWTMDFDDVEITWAFFAKINFLNCKEYNLEDFAEESSSLAIIKVQ